ncbi:hypothetical protein GUJ93_ZPchr0023g33377 [Zizania palustris]|uniref:Endonuclease/exonuclease/phosphatase domain-containing protein n=1 Tax=Zizania palustris TaxID=103762 RepID=A0A8J5V9G1_ZIZPA|nr:hypothetical protein GUJ93_ZPchr0023g33377 [Zizania palustris]
MFLGDFNFYRYADSRNKSRPNFSGMQTFNDCINKQGLLETPLTGCRFTWSNMQKDPLLVQLDWCSTSANWISQYPNTKFTAMERFISDHIPCRIQIGTSIPRSHIFRLENFWTTLPGFLPMVESC